MKTPSIKIFYALVLCMFLGLTGCTAPRTQLSKRDVQATQRLIGIQMSDKAIDTLLPYLRRNRDGYDSLRKYPLGNDISPALRFDPRPRDFVLRPQLQPQGWDIPQGVEVPRPYDLLAYYSLPQLASLIKYQKISVTELTEFFLARLKKYQPKLQCTITLTDSLALAQAKRADQEIKNGGYRGILHGIPYGAKDLISVAGHPTTWGARPYRDQQFDQTATVIKKLEEAGAILVAKLVSGALARGDVWFDGRAKNPWDTTQGASGSSAGSGSATSAGLVPFALGTETYGSILSPSNRTGITGLRPTFGRVSRHGVMTLSWSMDKLGPMARSAEDCAIVLEAIQGHDPGDRSTVDLPFGVDGNRDLSTLRVAYLQKDIEQDTTEGGENLRKALKVLRELGVDPVAVEMPKGIPYDGLDIILRSEAGAFFDGLVRSGRVDLMVEQNRRSRANSLRQSRFIPAVEYLQANRQRQVLIEKMHEIIKGFDVLISPTFGNDQLFATNLTGHPAIAVPTGLDKKNHPTSMTLVGNLYDEASILLLAMAFQENTPFDEMHPPGYP